jgi:hypothetical protein
VLAFIIEKKAVQAILEHLGLPTTGPPITPLRGGSVDRRALLRVKAACHATGGRKIAYLDAAIDASPSEYVFPGPDGKMMAEDTKVEVILRRALGRAGVVTGYRHSCRRCKAAGVADSAQLATGANPRKCSRCRMQMWCKPIPRHLRFHDLRHTTATLILAHGGTLWEVQKISGTATPTSPADGRRFSRFPWLRMVRRGEEYTQVHARARQSPLFWTRSGQGGRPWVVEPTCWRRPERRAPPRVLALNNAASETPLCNSGHPLLLSLAKISVATLDVGRRSSQPAQQCPSYSLCWALCALR